MKKNDLGREEGRAACGGNYSATENSLGATHGASYRPVTPELDEERLSVAAEPRSLALPCTPDRQGLPLGTQPETI